MWFFSAFLLGLSVGHFFLLWTGCDTYHMRAFGRNLGKAQWHFRFDGLLQRRVETKVQNNLPDLLFSHVWCSCSELWQFSMRCDHQCILLDKFLFSVARNDCEHWRNGLNVKNVLSITVCNVQGMIAQSCFINTVWSVQGMIRSILEVPCVN